MTSASCLKLLAANHLPPNQERTPHAYYLFLSLWSCRFSLSLSPFFHLHRCNQDSFFSIRCLFSLHSLLTRIHAKEKKAMAASVERRNAKMRGRERRERASKKRKRRLGLRTILQCVLDLSLFLFLFLFIFFFFMGCVHCKEGRKEGRKDSGRK